MKEKLIAVVAAATLCATLAACGSTNGATSDGTDSTDATAASSSDSATLYDISEVDADAFEKGEAAKDLMDNLAQQAADDRADAEQNGQLSGDEAQEILDELQALVDESEETITDFTDTYGSAASDDSYNVDTRQYVVDAGSHLQQQLIAFEDDVNYFKGLQQGAAADSSADESSDASQSSDSSAQSGDSSASYQEIYDEYAQKMNDETPKLVQEFQDEAAASGDIEEMAEICSDKITSLAEICTEGASEMAEVMYRNGDDYSVYEEWAGKLTDLYEEDSAQITDAYTNAATSSLY